MKTIILCITCAVVLLTNACVDDYEDANPPLRLDAPYSYVTPSLELGEDGDVDLEGGEEVTFSVNIVDAPGELNSIDYSFSKGGEVVSSTFDQLIGATSGYFEVTVRTPQNLNGTTTFTMEINDAQPEPKTLSISNVLDVTYAFEGADFEVTLGATTARSGDEVPVIVTINDVPSGGIASLSIAGTAGVVTFDEAELNALVGQSSATISGTLTVGEVSSTGEREVIIGVTDQLQNRQVLESADILLICPAEYEVDENPSTQIAGSYTALVEGTTEYDSAFVGLETMITITKINDGQFTISDVTFGVNEAFYNADGDPRTDETDSSFPAEPGVINICGSTITEPEGEENYTITGSVRESVRPGTLVLNWSNSFGDSGRAILTK